MKRLIKKNKYYDTKEVFWETIEVFINPSSTEIIDIKRTDGDIRGLWYFDGTVYAWPSTSTHNAMRDQFKELNYNQPHFFTDSTNLIKFHLEGAYIDPNEMRDAILLNKSILSDLINIDTATILICNTRMKVKDFLENNFTDTKEEGLL